MKTGMSRKTAVMVEGKAIELSNLGKVLFPGDGITKTEFMEYYERASGIMLPYLMGRPLSMERFPEGTGDEVFFQKRAPEYFPEWVNRVDVKAGKEGVKTQITCENKETLVYLANLVCIPHVWLSRVDKPERPDKMIFDIDPPGDGFAFEPVRYAALILKEVLEATGITPYVMTTGSKGVHVVVPLSRADGFESVRGFAMEAAEFLARLAPGHFTAEFSKARRAGRICLDVYRNAFSQTSVAPYAVRANPGAPVATPIEWDELRDKTLHSCKYTIRNVFRRLKQRGDPWHKMEQTPHRLEEPRRRLKTLL